MELNNLDMSTNQYLEQNQDLLKYCLEELGRVNTENRIYKLKLIQIQNILESDPQISYGEIKSHE